MAVAGNQEQLLEDSAKVKLIAFAPQTEPSNPPDDLHSPHCKHLNSEEHLKLPIYIPLLTSSRHEVPLSFLT